MAWTLPRDWVVNEIVTAAQLNTHLRDNTRYQKGLDGTVLIESALQVDGDTDYELGVETWQGEVSAVLWGDATDALGFLRTASMWKLTQGGTAYYMATPAHLYIPMGGGHQSLGGNSPVKVNGSIMQIDKSQFPYSTVEVALDVAKTGGATHTANYAKLRNETDAADLIAQFTITNTDGERTRSSFTALTAGEKEYAAYGWGDAAGGDLTISPRLVMKLS